jgi:hypothetical protein
VAQSNASRVIRFLLFAVGGLVFGLVALIEGIGGLQNGVISFKLRGRALTFIQSEAPLGFYFWVGLDIIGGCLFLAGALISILLLLKSSSAKRDQAINSTIQLLETRAPSGLRPLWIGLAIVLTAALIYVA